MNFETKEEVFEKVISQEKPLCPYCGQEMNLWEVPDMAIDDGLGWGTPYLFICFNDECSLYSGGWDNIKENYGRTASYRCLCYPDSGVFDCMSVYGPMGGRAQILDEEVLLERKRLAEKTEKGLVVLEEYAATRDAQAVFEMLIDPTEPGQVRMKAAEILGDIGGTNLIDSLRDSKFGNRVLNDKTEKAILKIHDRHFTQECPFCAEIIKRRAKICKFCGKEIYGN